MGQEYGLEELFSAAGLDSETASMLSAAWEGINGSSSAVDPAVFEPSRKAQGWNLFSWGVGAREARDNREAWYQSGKDAQELKGNLFNTILGNALSGQGLVEQAKVMGSMQEQIAKTKLAGDLQRLGIEQDFRRGQNALDRAHNEALQKIITEGTLGAAGINADATKYGADKQFDLGKLQDATQRYGVDKEFELGKLQDATQRYGVDKEFELGVKELSSLDNRALMSGLSSDFGNFMNAYGQSLGNLFAATAWRR